MIWSRHLIKYQQSWVEYFHPKADSWISNGYRLALDYIMYHIRYGNYYYIDSSTLLEKRCSKKSGPVIYEVNQGDSWNSVDTDWDVTGLMIRLILCKEMTNFNVKTVFL